MRLDAVGYGAGDARARGAPERDARARRRARDDAASGAGAARGVLIETNLDDLSPELVPDAAERCFAAGALDVWVSRGDR